MSLGLLMNSAGLEAAPNKRSNMEVSVFSPKKKCISTLPPLLAAKSHLSKCKKIDKIICSVSAGRARS